MQQIIASVWVVSFKFHYVLTLTCLKSDRDWNEIYPLQDNWYRQSLGRPHSENGALFIIHQILHNWLTFEDYTITYSWFKEETLSPPSRQMHWVPPSCSVQDVLRSPSTNYWTTRCVLGVESRCFHSKHYVTDVSGSQVSSIPPVTILLSSLMKRSSRS